jgi:S1-C subfamily serine protease
LVLEELAMTFAEELKVAVAAASQSGLRSLVAIGTRGPTGSGMVVADGKVLTSAHNVRFQGRSLVFADGAKREAELVTADISQDLAVLSVDTTGASPISWSEDSAELGTPILAAANLAGRGATLSFGIVAGVDQAFRGPEGRRIKGSFEHTAPLPHGASGGPVLDFEGRVLGINTKRMGEALYAALAAGPQLRAAVEALSRGETPVRGWLGVGLLPPELARRLRLAVGLSDRSGALVREVTPEGPAAKAGIRKGDLLVSVNGRELQTADDLYSTLLDHGPGSSVKLGVVRGQEELEVEAVTAAEPERGAGGHRHPHPRRGGWGFGD